MTALLTDKIQAVTALGDAWWEDRTGGYIYQQSENIRNTKNLSITFPAGMDFHRRQVLVDTLARLNTLLHLPAGWDGLNAKSVSAVAALTAIDWLALLLDDDTITPQAFPLPNGGVQLEWLAAGDGLELEVSPLGDVGVLGVDSAGNVIVEGEYPDPDGAGFIVAARKHLGTITDNAASANRIA